MDIQEYRRLGVTLATQYLEELENNTNHLHESTLRCNLINAIHMAGYTNVEDFKKEFGLNT